VPFKASLYTVNYRVTAPVRLRQAYAEHNEGENNLMRSRNGMFLALPFICFTGAAAAITFATPALSDPSPSSPAGNLLLSRAVGQAPAAEILPVTPAAINADGNQFASVTAGNELVLYATSGTKLRSLGKMAGRVYSLAFSNSGAFIAVAGEGRTIRVYNTITG
jgi:hypothetical protein